MVLRQKKEMDDSTKSKSGSDQLGLAVERTLDDRNALGLPAGLERNSDLG
jgi:hypothetical protein